MRIFRAVQLASATLALTVLLVGMPPLGNDALAQGASAALPTGDQIVTKYEQALGGTAALARVTTRTTKTRRIVDIGTPSDHDLLRHSKRGPGGVFFSIMNHNTLDGQFLYWLNGCDGKTGWGRGQKDTITNEETVTGGICEHELSFYGYFILDAARMKKAFRRLDVKGIYKIVPTEPSAHGQLAGGKGPDLVPAGARDTYLVLGIPAGKDEASWLYFDTQTGFLLRRAFAGEGPTPIPAGGPPRITDFIQYREVGDGTRMPFQFVTIGPNATRVRGIHYDVVDNAPIDDKVFLKPKVGSRPDKGL
jgi:hypothetical protein